MADLTHVGLTVRDLDTSLAFYRDIVGLTLERTGSNPPAFPELTNNPRAEIRFAHLNAGSFILQLIEYVHGAGGRIDPRHNVTGSPHFSFAVRDAPAKYAELRDRGDVDITSDVIQITPTRRSFYVRDPDGVPVEFLEYGER